MKLKVEINREEMQNADFETKVKKSQEIIKNAIEHYNNVGFGFSGGTDSLVLAHLTLPFKKDMPALFVNTQHQFAETYAYVEKIKKDYGMNLTEVKADSDRYDEFKAKDLGEQFFVVCCEYHKINPLVKGIKDLGLDAFLTGIRGVEHEERAKETIVSPREGHDRINPMLFWTNEDVMQYVKLHNLETNPLYDLGYRSLGCKECTKIVKDKTAHERAGRNQTREKVMERLRALGYT